MDPEMLARIDAARANPTEHRRQNKAVAPILLEALKGDRTGQHSIRINDQYRICFKWRDGDAYDVEIVDYQ